MSVPRSYTLDCQIQVRKYVLVAHPSRWNQKGRVVVQSPMLEIPKTVLRVPVRRYNGEEENSVCLIPTEDIEKDSSIAFKQSQVDTKPFPAAAHGVALFDSLPSDSLKYRRGDKFWISIGPDFKDYKTTVPVINLHTYEIGIISIDQVCWYPKIQGPDNELWTPGGGLRSQKLEGSKRFAYYSYVIRQRLPGPSTSSESLTQYAESVLLYSPVRGSKVENTQHLSIWESQNLFRKRLRLMESILQAKIALSSPAEKQFAVSPASLPTPPSSPELDHLRRRLSEVQTLRSYTSNGKRNSTRSQELWNGVLGILPAHNGPYICRQDITRANPTHQPFLGTRCQSSHKYAQATSTASAKEENGLESDHITACTSLSETSHSSQLVNINPGDFDATPIGAQILLEIFNDSKVCPAVSVTCPAVFRNTYSIREAWQKNELKQNPVFMDLCDQRDYHCPTTSYFAATISTLYRQNASLGTLRPFQLVSLFPRVLTKRMANLYTNTASPASLPTPLAQANVCYPASHYGTIPAVPGHPPTWTAGRHCTNGLTKQWTSRVARYCALRTDEV